MAVELHPFTSGRWLNNLNDKKLEKNWIINRDGQDKISSFCYVPNNNISNIFLGSFPIWEIVTHLMPEI